MTELPLLLATVAYFSLASMHCYFLCVALQTTAKTGRIFPLVVDAVDFCRYKTDNKMFCRRKGVTCFEVASETYFELLILWATCSCKRTLVINTCRCSFQTVVATAQVSVTSIVSLLHMLDIGFVLFFHWFCLFFKIFGFQMEHFQWDRSRRVTKSKAKRLNFLGQARGSVNTKFDQLWEGRLQGHKDRSGLEL